MNVSGYFIPWWKSSLGSCGTRSWSLWPSDRFWNGNRDGYGDFEGDYRHRRKPVRIFVPLPPDRQSIIQDEIHCATGNHVQQLESGVQGGYQVAT